MRTFARLATLAAISALSVLAGACGPKVQPILDFSVPPDLSTPHVPRTKVDVLFMMDDSGGTSAIRQRFTSKLATLIAKLDETAGTRPISYHFGVVTSDLGAPGLSCGTNLGAKLQAKGAAATAGCSGPTTGNFLVYDQADHGNDTVPSAQSVTSTLACMLSVGDKGCGFEMPLEAAYRALHDPIAENAGFLRDDAALAVIFVTDEDDCSVDDMSSPLFGSDTSTYGPLTSFRCARFGVTCDGKFPLPSTAPASYRSCQPATKSQGGLLADVDKYIAFFARPKSEGGVKADPRDVVLAAIDAPTTPFTVETGSSPDVCGQGTTSCAVLGHSCASPSSPATTFADPAVRINALIGATGLRASACDDDQGYAIAVTAFAQRIVAVVSE